MKEIYIVVRPDMDFDFCFEGAFSNVVAAYQCARDPEASYEAMVWCVSPSDVKDIYESPYDTEDDEDDVEEP